MEHAVKPYRKNVGIVVFNDKGQVLVGERIGWPGVYQFPQGGLNKGETPIDAARRELYEETSLQMDGLPIHEMDEWLTYEFPDGMDNHRLEKYRGQEQRWFFFHWSGNPATLDLDVHHREFTQVKWADLDDIVADIVEFKRPVYLEIHGVARQVIGAYLAEDPGQN
jgi:putative (di)nucleoside polyphosphate hydrolase